MAINIGQIAAENAAPSIEVILSDGSTVIMHGLLTLSTDAMETATQALRRIEKFGEKTEKSRRPQPQDRRRKASEDDKWQVLDDLIAVRRDFETIIKATADDAETAERIIGDPGMRQVQVQVEVVKLWGEETGAGEA